MEFLDGCPSSPSRGKSAVNPDIFVTKGGWLASRTTIGNLFLLSPTYTTHIIRSMIAKKYLIKCVLSSPVLLSSQTPLEPQNPSLCLFQVICHSKKRFPVARVALFSTSICRIQNCQQRASCLFFSPSCTYYVFVVFR